MIVIVPHQDIELKLINSQKRIISELIKKNKDLIPYASMPLWVETEFKSIEEAKTQIKKITIFQPEYDVQKKALVCPVEIRTEDKILTVSLDFIFRHCEDSEHSEEDAAIHIDDEIFPLDVKIFRLGECTSSKPGIFELSNTVWKKLTS